MNTYEVIFNNETFFIIIAGDEDEAIKKALDRWNQRAPLTAIKLKKKVKRTIHYTVQNYYVQNVWVDENMDEDDIIELWEKDTIYTLDKPEIDDTRVNDDIFDVWVE